MKNIAILGSTGSVGSSTLDVIEAFPERFRVVALAAGRNLDILRSQIEVHQPEVVDLGPAPPSVGDPEGRGFA